MAATRAKKTKTSTDNEASTRQQDTHDVSNPVTPQRSPQKRIMGITEKQKQALVDNLQLEGAQPTIPPRVLTTDFTAVTERARKLRAQYALQAQSLRSRIELRINRIPKSMRQANMGELLAQYEEKQRQQEEEVAKKEAEKANPETAEPEPQAVPGIRTTKSKAAPKARGLKRNRFACPGASAYSLAYSNSDTMEAADTGNIMIHEDPIPNPKKRTRTTRNAEARHPPNPSTVLSPKSNNSRTLPQSPIRRPTWGSPQKHFHSRPASPLKPVLSPAKPNVAAAAAATATLASMVTDKPKPGRPKAAVRKAAAKSKKAPEGKEEPEGMRTVSSTSSSSAISTGTTIVKNTKKTPTTLKKGARAKAAGKQASAVADPPPAGRRVLRKRA